MLKNPSHLMALDALLATYPDAIVVQTHRDPVTCLASMCSLSEASTRGTSTVFVGDVIGRTQLDLLRREVEAAAAARASVPGGQFVDIAYDDLVADPVGTVGSVLGAAGAAWDEAAQVAVEAELAASRSGVRAPKHAYDLADYGLTAGEVRAVLG